MRLRITLLVFLALAAAIRYSAAQQTNSAKVMLEAAKKKELVDGDLKGAVEQYRSLALRFKDDHAIAADALIRMADALDKLGDPESDSLPGRPLCPVLHDREGHRTQHFRPYDRWRAGNAD